MAKTNYSPTFPMYPGDAVAINADDSAAFTPSVIFVGTGGTVKITTAQGTDVVFTGVNAGTVLPVQVIKVWATGTVTATGFVRIY